MSEWQHVPLTTCCCPYCAQASTNSRRSRVDGHCTRERICSQAPQQSQVTLFRTHSVRRIGPLDNGCAPAPPPDTTSVCCQTCNFGDSGIYLSSPFILKDMHSRHRSPIRTCRSPSGNRNVRFCSSDRPTCLRPASPCPSECGNRCTSPLSRSSSLVRVYSRSNSPMCETIVAASLPSKSAGTSVYCECNLPPPCAPKPRGNLKYSHILRPCMCCPSTNDVSCSCNCSPCCDIKFPPPPPIEPPIMIPCSPCEVKTSVECCTNTEPQCEAVQCCKVPVCCPPPKPCPTDFCCQANPCQSPSPCPKIERYETTSCRVERITTRRRRALPIRSFSCTRSCPDASYYLRLIERKENDLWNKISECEMDLASYECMMSCDVIDYIKEAISKSRELIDCDFRRIRRVCEPDVVPCCCCDGCCERRNCKTIEELWRDLQCKISEVSCMMDRIDRLRSNGWK
nr:hypothetical transcript [Hymenolepis microstoma]